MHKILQKFIEWNAPSPLWKFLSPNVTGKPKKKKKMHLILIQSNIPFGCTKSVALRYYFQIFTKSLEWFLKKSSLYFTSPMKISKSKCNRKKTHIHLILIQSKIPFWMHKVSGIKILFPNFLKKLSSGFWKKGHFTSPPLWKFSSINVTAKLKKKRKNPFNFDSIQNSFWMHKVTCIRMIFTRFHKKINE